MAAASASSAAASALTTAACLGGRKLLWRGGVCSGRPLIAAISRHGGRGGPAVFGALGATRPLVGIQFQPDPPPGQGGGKPTSGLGQGRAPAEARFHGWHAGIAVVPQAAAWVVERLGRFHKTLDPGFHFLIPLVDRVAYKHSLKEEAITIPNQQAITRDNVTIGIDGVLYFRIIDPYQASYGVNNPIFAVTQLAQTTMRSEIGKMTLDTTFEERDTLNGAIVSIVNEAAMSWGIQCLRYEIRDIVPPSSIKQAMEMQAEAERRRRAEVLQSEGDRQSEVNIAQGKRQAAILAAEGEARAILERARATAEGIQLLSTAISSSPGGEQAAALRVAEQWVGAWREMARTSNTVVVPADPGNASAMVSTALSIFRTVNRDGGIHDPDSGGGGGIPPADGRSAAFSTEPLPAHDVDLDGASRDRGLAASKPAPDA